MNLQEVILAVQNGGLKFEPMSDYDRQGFSGAPAAALMASSDLAIFILSENQLSVVTDDFETTFSLRSEVEIG